MAGFAEVDFLPEPLAAAAFYVNRTPREQTLLVFDFGGGTLDLTVLKVSAGEQQEVLASVGVLVGGDDLDSAIMRGKVAPDFGTESAIDVNFDGRLVPFPEPLAQLLEQWQTIPALHAPGEPPDHQAWDPVWQRPRRVPSAGDIGDEELWLCALPGHRTGQA